MGLITQIWQPSPCLHRQALRETQLEENLTMLKKNLQFGRKIRYLSSNEIALQYINKHTAIIYTADNKMKIFK